jgi:hypothetical protein
MHRQTIVTAKTTYATAMRIDPDQATCIPRPRDPVRVDHQRTRKQAGVPMHHTETVRLAQLLPIPPVAAQHARTADPVVPILAVGDGPHFLARRAVDGGKPLLCR